MTKCIRSIPTATRRTGCAQLVGLCQWFAWFHTEWYAYTWKEKHNTAGESCLAMTTLICPQGPGKAIKLLTRDSIQDHLSGYQLD